MATAGIRGAFFPLSLAVMLLLPATMATADALRVQWSTRVATGETPRLTLTADEAVDGVQIELVDDGGRVTSARLGSMARGTRREVLLPAVPGRRRFQGRLTIKQRGREQVRDLSFETVVAPQLSIEVDRARVDLPARRLEARFSRAAARAEVKVLDVSGATIVEATQDLGGAAAGTPLVITWPAAGGTIGRIDLRLHDTDGFYAGVSLHPWSVHIPHEEVGFATDAATIAGAEQPKLQASLQLINAALARHRPLGPIRLYIAGHTDSVGRPGYNVALSQRRAQAIAGWFRQRGLRLPIFFEGFGEHAPLVSTPDETDEPRNRRVDYILAIEDPIVKASSGFRPAWKRIP